MADEYQTNLLRVQFAATWFSISLQAGREMFGKSYLSLSPVEKAAVDQTVQGALLGNYQTVTPQWFASQQGMETVGFHDPTQTAPPSSPPKAAK